MYQKIWSQVVVYVVLSKIFYRYVEKKDQPESKSKRTKKGDKP